MGDQVTIEVERAGIDTIVNKWGSTPGVEIRASSGFDGITLLSITASIATIAQLCWDVYKARGDAARGTYRFEGKEMTGLTPRQMVAEATKDARVTLNITIDIKE
jgi:hypothetical protein